MPGNGTCTWTWDGTFWTCIDQCDDGKECNDILETSPDEFHSGDPAIDADPDVRTFLRDVKRHTDPETAKVTFLIPDGLFRRVVKLRQHGTNRDLDDQGFLDEVAFAGRTARAGAKAKPVTVVVDCH